MGLFLYYLYEGIYRVKSKLLNAGQTYHFFDAGEMSMQEIFPYVSKGNTATEPDKHNIKIRVFIWRASDNISSLKTLYEAFQNDERCAVQVIHVPVSGYMEFQSESNMINSGIPYISFNEMDANVDSDIDVFIGCYRYLDISHKIKRTTRHSKLRVALISRSVFFEEVGSINGIWISRLAGYVNVKCDYYLVDYLLYEHMRQDDNEKRLRKVIGIGNPKYDLVFRKLNNLSDRQDWKKIKGKKVILWAPVHGVRENYYWATSILSFGKVLMDEIVNRKELALIIRLHNVLIDELLRYGHWNKSDIDDLRRFCEQSDNIVFDENPNNAYALTEMDALLTDPECSIAYTALATMKPIGILHEKGDIGGDPVLLNSFYDIVDKNGIEKFCSMLLQGDDPMYDKRKAAYEKYIINFDGKNGERIKDMILEKLWK